MENFSSHLVGRERICPRCGRIWRLGKIAHATLLAGGVVSGVGLSIVPFLLLKGSEAHAILWLLWLPVGIFIIWPAVFGMIGNFFLR